MEQCASRERVIDGLALPAAVRIVNPPVHAGSHPGFYPGFTGNYMYGFNAIVRRPTPTATPTDRALSRARYNEAVVTRDIRAYMSRDWRAAREAKDSYWGARIARLGPLEGLRIADELRRQALSQNPTWPRPSDRRHDLLAHARLVELFHRAGPARRA